MELDDTDRTILRLLQDNARLSNAEIARRVGLVTSAVFQRVRRLEREGVLERYACILNARALNLGLTAWIAVQTAEGDADHCTGALLAELPNVLEVHRVLGQFAYLIKVRVRNTEALATLLEQIGGIAAVVSTRTRLVVRTIKESTQLPVPAL